LREVKRIIQESEITKEDDHNWPEPDRVGRQELEIKMGREHISFTVNFTENLIYLEVFNSKIFASVQK